MNEELEGLPAEICVALNQCDEWMPHAVMVFWGRVRAELVRLAAENAELCASVRGMSVCEAAANIPSVMEYIKELESRAERAERENAELRKPCTCDLRTKRVGAWCEVCNPRLTIANMKESLAESESALAKLRAKVESAPLLRVGDPAWSDGTLAEMDGVEVHLVKRNK